MAFTYHSPGELQALGEKIRDKAIQVTMDQAASYGAAQQAANNDATRSDTGQLTQVPGYTTPDQGRPDDGDNLQSYVGQAYAGVPAMFAAFGLPNPDDSGPMLDALYSVAATVEVDLQLSSRNNTIAAPSAVAPISGSAPVGEVVDLINGHLKEWTGDAALAFELYLKNNVRAAALQREIALSLTLGLEAQLEINRRINTDIWEIGQKTYKALDGLDAWCPGADASRSVALLTIAGAIAAVIFAGANSRCRRCRPRHGPRCRRYSEPGHDVVQPRPSGGAEGGHRRPDRATHHRRHAERHDRADQVDRHPTAGLGERAQQVHRGRSRQLEQNPDPRSAGDERHPRRRRRLVEGVGQLPRALKSAQSVVPERDIAARRFGRVHRDARNGQERSKDGRQCLDLIVLDKGVAGLGETVGHLSGDPHQRIMNLSDHYTSLGWAIG
jgi:hypothetical protein